MPARRRPYVALLTAVALLGLSGCQKPTPIVTVQSGGTSVHTDAGRWCFPGQSGDGCRTDAAPEPAVLTVTPGQTIGVDVDKAVVERHWFVQQTQISPPPGQQAAAGQSNIQDQHYFSFGTTDQPVLVQVVALDGGSDKTRTTGVWSFVLRPRR